MTASTILLIDDDPTTTQFLATLLARDYPAITIITAIDGVRGVQSALAHRATLRLVLLDSRMPGLDGRTVAAFLRLQFPTLPILPITGDAQTGSTYAALGCRLAVIKGVPLHAYREAIMLALTANVLPPPNVPLIRAMAEQAMLLAASEHVVVEKSTLQRLHAHLTGFMARRVQSRELTQSVKILERAL